MNEITRRQFLKLSASIEGDPDHPVKRGTLRPKGASLIDFVHSEGCITDPEYRAPGSNE